MPNQHKKSKALAALFASLIPGTGHFYVGFMQRGLLMMALLALDITAIVYFTVGGSTSIPLVVLLSLIIPVIYFYNIFHAVWCAEQVNRSLEPAGPVLDDALPNSPPQPMTPKKPEAPVNAQAASPTLGYVLIGGGVLFLMIGRKPDWMESAFTFFGSYFAAAAMIIAGVLLYLSDKRDEGKDR